MICILQLVVSDESERGGEVVCETRETASGCPSTDVPGFAHFNDSRLAAVGISAVGVVGAWR